MTNRSKIGLGTVQFGLSYGISNTRGQTSPQEVKKILQIAKKLKIDLLDSASGYGNAEEVLGQNNLKDFNLVSKFLPPAVGLGLKEQLEQSLYQLNVAKLYAYLAHRPLDLLSSPGQWKELQYYKEQGFIDKIGFSLNEPQELKKLLEAGMKPDLVQVPYNFFDRRFENAIKDLKNRGCEVHTRSTFLQGLFFMDPDKLDEHFAEVKPLLKKMKGKDESLPGKLLKFVVDRPFIDKVITGVENSLQLEQNISEFETASPLPELKLKISNKILIPSKWPKK